MSRNIAMNDVLVTIALASMMHLDWHVARPAEHHLSLGWPWHWLLAVPTFGLTAWYVVRRRPRRLFAASVAIIGTATLLAGVVEPLWEMWSGAPFAWTFGRMRLVPFAAFVATGLLSYAAVAAFAARAFTPLREPPARPQAP